METQIVKLKIDGVDVEVEKGRTILEAAEVGGIRIPTLCHDRRLIPFGACRLCIVQQKGRSELLPACFTPVKNGMEILTRSPDIFEARRLQLQLILLNHPMICPRCEKEGECGLQSLVYEYGVEERLYPWQPITFPADDLSPLLQRDANKCIVCGRCVRICDEVQGVGELSFTQRGIKTAIDTDFHRPIQCEFCGQCMDTCPVGAITSNRFDYATKAWELKETTTPCPYCACGCLLTIGSKEGEIKRVFSDPERGPSDGNLCVRGRFGWDFVHHPDRIRTPLIRVNGTFKEASWEEALRFVADTFEKIKDEDGPDGLAGIVSSRLTNEEYYLFEKLFRTAIGTGQFDHDGGSSYRGLTEGLAKTLGMAASTNSIREIRHADCILVIGVDPAATHPIIKNEINLAIRRNRAQLIVLGCHDIKLTGAAKSSPLLPSSISLLERPGMEVSLLNAMIRTILREGLEDKSFVAERTEGIEDLREKMASLHDESLTTLSETKRADIEKAARDFARARRAMILIGSDGWSFMDQKEIAVASSNLALITGHIGKESCGILVLLEKCNGQGAIDMGVFAKGEEGAESIFKKAEEGKVKALYVIGADPLITYPDPARLKKVFGSLRALVVQDLFMTETAKMAHVVLPASSFVEKTGTLTNLERRVQRLHPLRPPPDGSEPTGSKSDFDIFLQLLHFLECPTPAETPEAAFEEICHRIPHYRDIRDGEQWPNGSTYLYSDGFPNGRAKLITVKERVPSPIREGYPFQLVQRPSLFQSGLLSSKSEALKMVSEKPHLQINPEDARLLNIEEGEVVQVSNHKGRSLKMKVRYSPRPHSGILTAAYPCSLVEEGVASVKVERLKRSE